MSVAASQSNAGWAEILGGGRAPRLLLIWLSVWLFAADSLVTATIMPSVGAALGQVSWFGWATAGYLLAAVFAGASSGLLARRLGLRRASAYAAVLYALGCGLSAWAPNMALFIAGRLLQGLGGGWVSGFASVAVGVLFADRMLPRIYASTAVLWGAATLLGPLVGGLFADAGVWRYAFWFFAVQGAGVAVASLWLLPGGEGRDKGAPIAWGQLALTGFGVALIGVADVTGGFASSLLLTLAGVGCLVATVWWDSRAKARLLPHGAGDLRSEIGAGFAAMFLLTTASMPLSVYGAAMLQTVGGYSAVGAGYIVAIESLAWSGAAMLVAHLSGPWPGRMIRLGAVMLIVGLVTSAIGFPTASLPWVIVAASATGLAFGFSYSFMSTAILAATPDDERGLAAAGFSTVRMTGSAAGAAASAAVANLSGFAHGFSAAAAKSAGVWMFVAMLPLAGLGLLAAWRVGRNDLSSQ